MSRERGGRVERIGALVGAALPARVREGLIGWRAVGVWPEVAGPDAARRSAAIAYRDGRLLVEVQSSAWMYQLSASKRRLLAELRRLIGCEVVRDIVFRINPSVSNEARAASEGGRR